ncbi:phospho-sugar mutase [Acidothermaceae bacterium B102]|nr:phospho-sugar mutase [Acidothermaceae bacterium B102]
MSDLRTTVLHWISDDPDPRTRNELSLLMATHNWDELDDRFAGRLQFGTAGLRGALGGGPNRMNRATVTRAAAGLAAYVNAHGGGRVVVGFDARHDSDMFAIDTVEVMRGAGLDAFLLPRPVPTPVLAYAILRLGCVAGVMVTASHNPAADNGYKVYLGDGSQIVPPADAEISAHMDAVGRLTDVPRAPGWTVVGDDLVDAYIAALVGQSLTTAREVSVAYTPLHGVGRDVLLPAFRRAGFALPTVVSEQGAPDPDFPTLPFPNPEEPGAMDLAVALGATSDIVIANDPDADRCCVAVGSRVLTGDEIGALLADHVLRNTHGSDRLVVTTIVSSTLLRRMAAAHGVHYAETLTGFKWIVRANPPGTRFVFGYEEALGYCIGAVRGPGVVRDKDGISAALAVAELAADLKAQGRTLLDRLDELAHDHGLHATAQWSVRVSELDEITAAMTALRSAAPSALGGHAVGRTVDLLSDATGLPPTDGVTFWLGGADNPYGRVVVRPSGTEPKLKAYLEVVVPVTSTVAAARAQAEPALAAIKASLREITGLA